MTLPTPLEPTTALVAALRDEGQRLGFAAIGVTDIELAEDEARLIEWINRGWHGSMTWFERHGTRRSRPAELVPGTIRVICARMDYWPEAAAASDQVLEDGERAYVSRYALGRDYHKVLRQRLQKLADWLVGQVGAIGYRVFTDSAPVLEKALARKAGLGFIGKHTNLIHPRAGSYFFLGEIYTDYPLPLDGEPVTYGCGTCSRCIDICPTKAIVAPFQLDARRCLSYLSIEHPGSIPVEFRTAFGNRIYGCDDCQLVCPWNKFARPSVELDFAPRHRLDQATLVELFSWTEVQFRQRMAGSAILRIGHERWLRNLAVGIGNGPATEAALAALNARADHPSAVVREHVAWALAELARRRSCCDSEASREPITAPPSTVRPAPGA